MAEKLRLHFNTFGARIPSEYREHLFPVTPGKLIMPVQGCSMKMASQVRDAGRAGLISHFRLADSVGPDIKIRGRVLDPNGTFHMAIQLSGGGLTGAEGVKGSFTLAAGNALIFIGEDQLMKGSMLPGPCFENISLTLSGGFLLNAMEPEQAPRRMRKSLEGGRFCGASLGLAPITPVMKRMALEMVCNPYHGPVEQLYLQGKILELMAELATVDRADQKNYNNLRNAVPSRVADAVDILLKHPENPPSTLELSELVGVSYKTLNRGFVKYLDTTVSQFARGVALDYAKKILAETDLTVGQVAYRCGYSSPSAFINAFRRRFGHSPRSERARY